MYYGTPIVDRLSRHNALVPSSGISGTRCRNASGIIDRIRWCHCIGIFRHSGKLYRNFVSGKVNLHRKKHHHPRTYLDDDVILISFGNENVDILVPLRRSLLSRTNRFNSATVSIPPIWYHSFHIGYHLTNVVLIRAGYHI